MSIIVKNILNQKYIPIICFRNVSTAIILQNHQKGRFMQKVMKESKNKKKWRNEAYAMPIMQSPTNLSEGATEGKRSTNARRIAVLNKLFMRYITDLMASGSYASVFLGRGLEINRVKVTPDFQGVNVFWIAKGTEEDENIATLLAQYSGNLRHELSQLRVMGNVPRIHFVKDKEYAKLIEVDLRLAKADFGEDYEPVQPSYLLRSEFQLHTTLPENLRTQIELLENKTEDEQDYEEPLPPMRMDVFGLNHTEIMAKVVRGITKSKALHRQIVDNTSNTQTDLDMNQNPMEYNSHRQLKEAFTKFLQKRQILREKAKKEKDKYSPDYLYMCEAKEILEDSQFWDELKEKDQDYVDELEDDLKH